MNMDGLVMKVGVFVKRSHPNGAQFWMPTSRLLPSFPLWYIDLPAARADCLTKAWRIADRKIRDMLKFDFPELSEEVISKRRCWPIRSLLAVCMCTS